MWCGGGLQAVSVEAKVRDFCSSVTVRQTFVNTESTPIEGFLPSSSAFLPFIVAT